MTSVRVEGILGRRVSVALGRTDGLKLHCLHFFQLHRRLSFVPSTKTNALIEASMGGSWLCFGFLLAAMIFMIW